MNISERPLMRPLELIPLGEEQGGNYVLRDPHGFAGSVVLPPAAALLVSLMNGQRTLGDIRQAYAKTSGHSLSLPEIQQLVTQLDELHLLEGARFTAHMRGQISEYESLDVRPCAHAGGAYPAEADPLREQLGGLFTAEGGPGLLPGEGELNGADRRGADTLCGVMSPHIDFHRGGVSFAWAYDRLLAETGARTFIVLGTAHTPLQGFYSVSQKHFATPLGTVRTNRDFVRALGENLAGRSSQESVAHIFSDELPHRFEHSIEFQVLMLQYVLGGRREFQIVPILVGSFYPFVEHGRLPNESPAVADFVAALQKTVEQSEEPVCYIAGVDMAHIGRQFGDEQLLDDERLSHQWADDQQLLAKACVGDAGGWFAHVAAQHDANRICGLAPTYTLLQALRPKRGELLKYDQAVSDDRTSCVSFASVAFYG